MILMTVTIATLHCIDPVSIYKNKCIDIQKLTIGNKLRHEIKKMKDIAVLKNNLLGMESFV